MERAKRSLFKVNLAKAQEMLNAGAMSKDVAKTFGVAPSYITQLKREGRLTYERKTGHRSNLPQLRHIQEMLDAKCSISHASRESGLSRSGIYKLIAKGKLWLERKTCPHCGHLL